MEEIFTGVIWKIFFIVFNYIGLPFRYIFFFLIRKKKSISFLNRKKGEEPKDTWFNQRPSNVIVGIVALIITLVILTKYNIIKI